MKTLHETAIKKWEEKRARVEAKRQRMIDNGIITPSHKKSPKKIQHWYSTRVLKEWAEERFKLFDNGPIRINCKWVMQIRGKHLRRLKKKMKIKQVGRNLVRDE
jgi:hypothetical protein